MNTHLAKVLTRVRDIVPPRAEEGVVTTSDLFGQNADTLIVESYRRSGEQKLASRSLVENSYNFALTRETTKQGVEDTSQRPHVDRLRVPLILDDLRGSVTDGTTWSLGHFVPDDLGQTEIGNLDKTDSTAASTVNKLTFILLLLVIRSLNRVLGRDNGDSLEQQVLRLDVSVPRKRIHQLSRKVWSREIVDLPVDNSSNFVQVTDTVGDLHDDVPRELFTKVRQLDTVGT